MNALYCRLGFYCIVTTCSFTVQDAFPHIMKQVCVFVYVCLCVCVSGAGGIPGNLGHGYQIYVSLHVST